MSITRAYRLGVVSGILTITSPFWLPLALQRVDWYSELEPNLKLGCFRAVHASSYFVQSSSLEPARLRRAGAGRAGGTSQYSLLFTSLLPSKCNLLARAYLCFRIINCIQWWSCVCRYIWFIRFGCEILFNRHSKWNVPTKLDIIFKPVANDFKPVGSFQTCRAKRQTCRRYMLKVVVENPEL